MITNRLLIIILLLFPFRYCDNGKAQSLSETTDLSKKYAGYPFIYTNHNTDLNITMRKTGPRITIHELLECMVLKDNASEFADSRIYIRSNSVIEKMEAYSLIPNGDSYNKLKVKQFTKTIDNEDYLYYDDSYYYGFVFPSVGKGVKTVSNSIYHIDDAFIPYRFFFGSGVPMDHSRFTVTFPEEVKISWRLFACDTSLVRMSIVHNGKQNTYSWETNGLKSYASDKLAPDDNYFRPHIMIQLTEYQSHNERHPVLGSTDDLHRWERNNIRKLDSDTTPEIKQLADSIVRGQTNAEEKVRSIYRWVQNNIKYIAIEDGINGFTPQSASLVIKRRYGDCKDKSAVLKALISAIGEKSSVAVVGTRELPYKISEIPSMSSTNHMVAVWWKNASTPQVLDGTARYCRIEDVPATIQGKECLISKGEDDYLIYTIPIAKADENMRIDTVRISINNGCITGEGKAIFTGEYKLKEMYALDGEYADKLSSKWTENLYLQSDKIELSNLRTGDFNNTENPFEVRYQFRLPDHLIHSLETRYLNLQLIRAFSDMEIKSDRTLPIELGSTIRHRMVTIFDLPDSNEVTELPNKEEFSNPFFGFTSEYKRAKNKIILTTDIHIDKCLIEKEDIQPFKRMIDKLKSSYRNNIQLQTISMTKH